MFSKAEELDRDIELTRNLNGMFVGMLEEDETCAFNRLIDRGLARRVYEGAGGFMGLAKVSIDTDI